MSKALFSAQLSSLFSCVSRDAEERKKRRVHGSNGRDRTEPKSDFLSSVRMKGRYESLRKMRLERFAGINDRAGLPNKIRMLYKVSHRAVIRSVTSV